MREAERNLPPSCRRGNTRLIGAEVPLYLNGPEMAFGFPAASVAAAAAATRCAYRGPRSSGQRRHMCMHLHARDNFYSITNVGHVPRSDLSERGATVRSLLTWIRRCNSLEP